jgi:hypothetical protein
MRSRRRRGKINSPRLQAGGVEPLFHSARKAGDRTGGKSGLHGDEREIDGSIARFAGCTDNWVAYPRLKAGAIRLSPAPRAVYAFFGNS